MYDENIFFCYNFFYIIKFDYDKIIVLVENFTFNVTINTWRHDNNNTKKYWEDFLMQDTKISFKNEAMYLYNKIRGKVDFFGQKYLLTNYK